MTDEQRFERRLEARLLAHVDVAGREFDAVALTRGAASAQHGRRWLADWLPLGLPRPIMLLLIGLLMALLGIAGLAAGSRLLDDRVPSEEHAPGTFARTGSMSAARYWHTAVLLPDGRVLITGGFPQVPDDKDPPVPAEVLSAEIHDPATGTFTALPALSPANQGSSATVLKDGRVLIAGGRTRGTSPHPTCWSTCVTSGTAIDTAVVFDPRTNTTTPAGPLNTPRYGHGAILLRDGRVLVVGGWTGSTPDVGDARMESLASAELYDPDTNAFAPAGSLAESVAPDMKRIFQIRPTMLPNGWVLVENQIFDPVTGSFHAQGAGDSRVTDPGVRYLSDGGELFLYDPVDWEASGGSAQPVIWGPAVPGGGLVAAELADERVLWTGGRSDTTLDAWIGDPLTHGSEPTGPMTEKRFGHTATLLADGRALVVGGWGTGELIPDTSTEPAHYSWRASLSSAELYLPPARSPLLEEIP